LFKEFLHSEKTGGFLLVLCTVISIILTNTVGVSYGEFWDKYIHWINDGLMAIFFLLVGLEIERELYFGELSTFKNAILPVLAAIGGMLFPAIIHFALNNNTATESGFGIPMATDIAFALGVLSLAGNRIPVALKIFLTALAIIDDLGAIAVIAIFYGGKFEIGYFSAAVGIFILLFIAGKRKMNLLPLYLVAGILMWYFMMKSGVHATIAGVLLAFAIPSHREDEKNISLKLQHSLHYPVAFLILPIFALANTAIQIPSNLSELFITRNSLGIMLGLVAGKFAGILLATFLAVKFKVGVLSPEVSWRHIAGISLLGGIGFTMSIFITNLAFTNSETIIASKISILLASLIAAILGLGVLFKVSSGTK